MKKVKSGGQYILIFDRKRLLPLRQQLEDSSAIKALCTKYSGWYTSDRVVQAKFKQFTKDLAHIVRKRIRISPQIEIRLDISSSMYLKEDITPACFVDFSTILWTVTGHNFRLTSHEDAVDEGPYYIRGWLTPRSMPPRSDDIETYRRISRIAECPELLFSKDQKMRALAAEVIKGS